MSYFKDTMETDAICDNTPLDEDSYRFLKELYEKSNGELGEFARTLLDTFTVALKTANSSRENTGKIILTVRISLNHFSELCGEPITKDNKDKMFLKVKEGLETLFLVSLEKRNYGNFRCMRLCSSEGIHNGNVVFTFPDVIAKYLLIQKPDEVTKLGKDDDINLCDHNVRRKGIIRFGFGRSFYLSLQSYPVMPVHPLLWRLGSKRGSNSYCLFRKIHEHKNMNIGKSNEDVISVQTLLKNAPYLPSYEEVMRTGGQVTQRIIEPLERDLNELSEVLTWEYCHRRNEPLTDKELSTPDYNTFKELLIRIKWKYYPERNPTRHKPVGKPKEDPFVIIRQGQVTNALSKTRARKDNTTTDLIAGTTTIKQGAIIVILPSISSGLKNSTFKLLDALMVKLTENGLTSPDVSLSMEEYMKMCGLKDKKEARKQVDADLETLRTIKVSYNDETREW